MPVLKKLWQERRAYIMGKPGLHSEPYLRKREWDRKQFPFNYHCACIRVDNLANLSSVFPWFILSLSLSELRTKLKPGATCYTSALSLSSISSPTFSHFILLDFIWFDLCIGVMCAYVHIQMCTVVCTQRPEKKCQCPDLPLPIFRTGSLGAGDIVYQFSSSIPDGS